VGKAKNLHGRVWKKHMGRGGVMSGSAFRRVVSDLALVRFLHPPYVLEGERLAQVVAEAEAYELWRRLEGRTVSDVLLEASETAPEINGDASLIDVASAMVKARSPRVVVHEEGRAMGAITARSLLNECSAI
jgi:CBS domain-containing protein